MNSARRLHRWIGPGLAGLALLLLVGCATITKLRPSVPLSASTWKAFERMKGPRGQTGVVVLDDNAKAWAARWELITDARTRIDLATFIYDNDVFGLAMLGALTERARAGVQIRMLIDGRGSLAITTPFLGRDLLQELVAAGQADVHVYNPPFNEAIGALLQMDAVQLSAGNHNKLLIVDDSVAITGGRNVNSHYFASLAEDKGAVSDTDVLVDGQGVVAALTDVMDREFYSWRHEEIGADLINIAPQMELLLMITGAMNAWVRNTVDDTQVFASLEAAALQRLDHAPSPAALEQLRGRLHELMRYPSVRGTVPLNILRREVVDARVITVRSRARGTVDNPAVEAIVRTLNGARRDVTIQSPSFILTPHLLKAFRRTSDRGVQITLLTNSPVSSYSRIAQALFIDSWPELIDRIPTLRVFAAGAPGMQHAKRIVFDDDVTFVGSYNFDPFSHQMNSETMVAARSMTLAAATRAELARVQSQMVEYLVARDEQGAVRRYPKDHPRAGQVIVDHGPRDHSPADEVAAIERTKGVLLGLRTLWDFDVVVW